MIKEKNKNFITESFQQASKKISPLWDIRDYVAVNPFFGFKETHFLKAAKYIQKISSKGIMPKNDFFLKKYSSGEIMESDLEVAIKLYQKERNITALKHITTEELLEFIKKATIESDELTVCCISDLYDKKNRSNTTELITNEISKWASAYFDEGQARWKISTEGLRFFSWWKSLAEYDKPFLEGNEKFSKLVKSLPREPEHALQVLTEKLLEEVPLKKNELDDYFYRLIYTTLGWSSYFQKFEFEAIRSGDDYKLKKVGGLIDIVTVRMAYDVSLLQENLEFGLKSRAELSNDDLDYSYIWLNAAENAYRRSIEEVLESSKKTDDKPFLPDVQMAFCIDVRSEILRRHLENLSPKIQTIGFAGFFGMPISLKGLGHKESDQNCPILLNSAFEISESVNGKDDKLKKKKKNFVETLYFKKAIQSSANSGFSFVETYGLGYIGKMIASSLGKKKPNIDISLMSLSDKEKKEVFQDLTHLSLDNKLSLAYGALKNMGLTKNFAKYVFFFGHGGETSNNPYASALDCGACAGHNGLGNAKLLATLLNDVEVREMMKQKGIDIPKTTVFLSGWHNTTKDELTLSGDQVLLKEQKDELKIFSRIFNDATKNCRKERAEKLPSCSNLKNDELQKELVYRANDWSEIRPEWGLARNASFIVARRELTRSLNLDGRSFLHDYDYNHDQDLSILELIMTAPMIVTNWINMQYYASTVDPKKFGAGNKVLNNVVGGIGCIQGNESDLLGGLTEQSVWYKGDYFHEPIRLQVFIESDTSSIEKVIKKHQLVQDLLSNNWLKVTSINPENKELKLYHANTWIPVDKDLHN